MAIRGAQTPVANLYPVQTPGPDIPIARKLDLLQKIDAFCRAYDRRITKVQTSFSSGHKLVLVATSEGLVVGDVQPLMRLNVLCIAEDGNNRDPGGAERPRLPGIGTPQNHNGDTHNHECQLCANVHHFSDVVDGRDAADDGGE